MPVYDRWVAIIDAKADPRFSFVGGWLVGPINYAENGAHFTDFDEALAHARTIHPVVWHDVTDQHCNGKFRSTLPFDATRWRVYDSEAEKWVNLKFTHSPRSIGQETLVKAKKGTFVLRGAPPLDMGEAERENYQRILTLLARLDKQVELAYPD